MKGSPYRPRPEGRRFTRSAAPLIETFGTGYLPRSFGLAAALLPGVARADGDHEPGQISLHAAAAPITDEMKFFHHWIWFPIILAICRFAANDAATAELP
jgi:hypothetical protein